MCIRDSYRYICFKKSVFKQGTKKKETLAKYVKLESLPPTSDTVKYHFYRVYLPAVSYTHLDVYKRQVYAHQHENSKTFSKTTDDVSLVDLQVKKQQC